MSTALVGQDGPISKISVLQSMLDAKGSALRLAELMEEASRLETQLNDDTKGSIEAIASRLGEIHAMIEAMADVQSLRFVSKQFDLIFVSKQFDNCQLTKTVKFGVLKNR